MASNLFKTHLRFSSMSMALSLIGLIALLAFFHWYDSCILAIFLSLYIQMFMGPFLRCALILTFPSCAAPHYLTWIAAVVCPFLACFTFSLDPNFLPINVVLYRTFISTSPTSWLLGYLWIGTQSVSSPILYPPPIMHLLTSVGIYLLSSFLIRMKALGCHVYFDMFFFPIALLEGCKTIAGTW